MAGQVVLSVAIPTEVSDWIDSKLKTPYGTLRRSDIVRKILEDAMLNDP